MIDQLASALARMLLPLRAALDDPASFEALLSSAGWPPEDRPATAALEAVGEALGIGDDLDTLLSLGDGEPTPAEVLLAVEAGAAVLRRLTELADATPQEWEQTFAAAVDALPPPLDDTASLMEALADVGRALVTDWIDDSLPVLAAVLRAAGVIRPSVGDSRPHALDVDALLALLHDPGGQLVEASAWGEPLRLDQVHDALLAAGSLLPLPLAVEPVDRAIAERYWGVDVDPPSQVRQYRLTIVDSALVADRGLDADVAVVVVPVPEGPDADPAPTGLLLAPIAGAGASVDLALGDAVTVSVDAAAAYDGSTGLVLRPRLLADDPGADPDTPPGLVVDQEPEAPTLDLAVGLSSVSGVWRLGAADGPRLEVRGWMLGVGIRPADDGVEPYLSLAPAEGIDLVIAPGDGAGFLGFLLGDGVTVTVDLDLDVSASGVAVNGRAGSAFTIPLDLTIGPLVLDAIGVAFEADAAGASLAATLDAGVALGPVALAVEGLGLALVLEAAPDGGGTLGPLDLSLALVGPTGVGVAIESDAVSGAGYLAVEGDRYIGGVSLQILAVAIDAFTVLDSALPDHPADYALLATLTARFPSLPLGFGFTLNGLGGLLALNRGIDAEALALGLRTGAADAVLFPDVDYADPGAVRDLVAQLDAYFPILDGNTVVGPVAEIGWGSPTIITGQLGVFVSLPQAVIVVLGSVQVNLPTKDAPLISLTLDTLGAIDLGEGSLLVSASLYDSTLLGFISLSGDAGAYVATRGTPYFLLSIGGYHPGFTPPGFVPAVLESPRRISADVPIGVGVSAVLDAYLAVTSNTVQAGGRFELEASTEVLNIEFTATGWFFFDVLVQFSPFLVLVDAGAGCTVTANDSELMGVDVTAHLEGPDPWYATATASFRMLGFKVTLDVEVGSRAAPEVAPRVDVLALMAAQLDEPSAWTTEPALASPLGLGILLAGTTSTSVLRPDETLVVRQSVAPLERTLERLGELIPEQTLVRVTSVEMLAGDQSLAGVTRSEALDWFAPSHYERMGPQKRLDAASYEQMPAGVRLGSDDLVVPADAKDRVAGTSTYETDVWEPSPGRPGSLLGTTIPLGLVRIERDVASVLATSQTAASLRDSRPVTVHAVPVAVSRVPTETGVAS